MVLRVYKILLFILLFTIYGYSQTNLWPSSVQWWHLAQGAKDSLAIQTSVPDSANLKLQTYTAKGPIVDLLGFTAGNTTGQGVFAFVDSAYSKDGNNVFDVNANFQYIRLTEQIIPDTVALKRNPGIVQNVFLTSLSSGNLNGGTRYTQVDSILPEGGGAVYDNVITGKQWVSVNLLETGIINALDFGLQSSNTASQNNTALRKMFTFAANIGASSVDSLSIYIPNGIYLVDSTQTILFKGSRATKIYGGTNTRFTFTANDTFLYFPNNIKNLRISDIYFLGNGRTAGGTIAISSLGVSQNIVFDNLTFENCGIGIDVFDHTAVSYYNNRFRTNHIGNKAEFNIDGHSFYDCAWTENDTGTVILGASNDGIVFSDCVWGRDSVSVVFRGGGGFSMIGGYMEDSRRFALIGTNDGNVTNGFRNINIIGLVSQQTAGVAGFEFYDNDIVSFMGCKFTGTTDSSFIWIETRQLRLLWQNNFLSGTKIEVRYNNDAIIYPGSNNLTLTSKEMRRYDANTITPQDDDTGAPYINEFFANSGDRYWEVWRTTGTNDRITGHDFSIRYKSSVPTVGFSTGSGYFDLGSNTGDPFAADSSSRGFLAFKRSNSMDDLFIGVIHAGIDRWYNISRDKFLTDPHMEGRSTFTTTDILDTLLLTNVSEDSFAVFVTPNVSTISDSLDLSVDVVDDTVFVFRANSTPSGLAYYWMLRRIKNK